MQTIFNQVALNKLFLKSSSNYNLQPCKKAFVYGTRGWKNDPISAFMEVVLNFSFFPVQQSSDTKQLQTGKEQWGSWAHLSSSIPEPALQPSCWSSKVLVHQNIWDFLNGLLLAYFLTIVS